MPPSTNKGYPIMTAVQKNQSLSGRVLRDASHGHAVEPPTADGVELELAEVSTPFDYLFESLENDAEAHLPADSPATIAAVVTNLKELGKKMVEPSPPRGELEIGDGNSTIPAVYTYFGQFIDHDITARTDRRNEVGHVIDEDLRPVAPATVKAAVRNERVPALDLDSVYGDGPTFPGGPETDAKDIYDGIKLKVGKVALVGKEGQDPNIPGVRIPLQADLDRDLPRGLEGNPSKANIADGRNDENLIVAQLHVAFLRFHNATVDWIRQHEPYYTDQAVFERARELVRWHYQWLVVHDYLATVALPGVVDEVVLQGNKLYEKRNGEVWMPLEFSVAAFRFGHTMVRGAYDFNRNFGVPGRVLTTAPVRLPVPVHRQGRVRRPDRRAALQLGDRVGPVRREGPALARALRPQGRHPAGQRAVHHGQREPGARPRRSSSRSSSTWPSATCCAATSCRSPPDRRWRTCSGSPRSPRRS